ncbi:uncharacterized protein YbjQ (UPF0145 family) [Sphingomonas naasensis]|uniref:Uncharacterized protein n=1 Tax=Sphingomonas naasensis TaxID=1344951 RepID=A0A4S1WMP0_9SPHN|nr:hypothetical protein [Sphingomonas naasensis]NIJ20448.1 uncharacterized protein YbjQ (UPF0145 family) [Sphingomonas naasensis]TGX44549.1 hypothetical protein E5A74_07160 [Sphingomonas naasensis]
MLNGSGMTRMGPVQVRLSGVIKVDEDDKEIPAVNTPTVAEATALLDRSARVNGADGVIGVGSDYRRITIGRGPLSTQTLVAVQAWGTAVREAEVAAKAPDSAAGEEAA